MDLLKEIGAILGFLAFGGFAVLVFMTFQQARHLRRLREWAGRAPERAALEEERAAAASGEATVPAIAAAAGSGAGEARADSGGPGRLARLRGEVAYRYEELDKRSPVSPAVLGLGILALVAAAAIVTGGFGLLGGGSNDGGAARSAATGSESKPVEVAVLNGTAPEGGVGVPGTAKAASGFVEDAGWKVGEVGDAGSFPTSSVMYEDGFKSDAKKLAGDLSDQLGDLEVVPITSEVRDVAAGADVAVVVGQDDQGIAG